MVASKFAQKGRKLERAKPSFPGCKTTRSNLHSYATIQLATYSKIAESSTLAHYRVAAIVSYKPTHLHCLPSHPLSKPSIPIGGKSQSVYYSQCHISASRSCALPLAYLRSQPMSSKLLDCESEWPLFSIRFHLRSLARS